MKLRTYDAILLVSFGGPEGPDDVVPFLENVTRGRGIPRDRLEQVGKHYFLFGGVSPINGQNRELLDRLRAELARRDVDVPVYWGNRNWGPYLHEALGQMRADGVQRALALFTSAYASYSGCRQYREDLYEAGEKVGDGTPRLDRVRQYFNLPGFVEANVDAVVEAFGELPEASRDAARLVFTTHSLPTAAAETSGPEGGAYLAQHREVARLVAAGVAERTGADQEWDLVFNSRSGPPQQPWLEPDVNDHLEELAGAGVPAVVVAPIGFVSDHMEVVYDLDVEAKATAERLGLGFARASSAGTHPAFVSGLVDLLLERDAVEAGEPVPRSVCGALPPWHDTCPVGCCPGRAPRPAVAGR